MIFLKNQLFISLTVLLVLLLFQYYWFKLWVWFFSCCILLLHILFRAFRCAIKLLHLFFICLFDFVFVMLAFIAMNLPVRTAPFVSHESGYVVLCFFFICIYSSHLQYILTAASPILSPLLPVPYPDSQFCQIHCSSISLKERAGLPERSTEYGMTECNKTRCKPSYKGWRRQTRKGPMSR